MDNTVINRAVLKGIKVAFDNFESWTYGSWPTDYGVESVVQVHVASELAKARTNPRYPICLEPSFGEILDLARASGKGNKPKEISWSKRADIAVFNSRNRPLAVVEVKRKWVTKSCVEDLKRIAALVKHGGPTRGGSVRNGYLVFYIHRKGNLNKVRKAIKKLEESIQREWKNRFGLKYEVSNKTWRKPWDDDEYAHGFETFWWTHVSR